MKNIEKLLPAAIQVATDNLARTDRKSVSKEYDGYVASFAPSLITAGLLPTLSFYSDRHKISDEKKDADPANRDKREPRRIHVLEALLAILKAANLSVSTKNDLLDYALASKDQAADQRQLRKDLTEVSIALKLALRNFKQV